MVFLCNIYIISVPTTIPKISGLEKMLFLERMLILLAFRKQNYYHFKVYWSISLLFIFNKGTSCVQKYFPWPVELQGLTLYKKVNSAAGFTLVEGNPLSLPAAMGSAFSPPNQAAECGVCILTTCWSRRRGIQPTQPRTQNSPPDQSQPPFLIQRALRKSYQHQ